MKHSPFRLLLLSLFLLAFLSQISSHTCIHDKLKPDFQRVDFPAYIPDGNRMLANYQAIRLYFDYSNFQISDLSLRDYIINQLVIPSQNYIQSAVKAPVAAEKLTFPVTTMCSGDIKVPTLYQSVGVDADLVLFVTASVDSGVDYLAYSLICILDQTTSRPIGGRLHFNIGKVQQTALASKRENDLVTTMHEITHMLGFSLSVYDFYINATTGATLTGHRFNKTINGMTVPILNVEPLTTRLRTYFNCPTLEGAYLENEGNSGSFSTHFERRVFYNEYMTASRLDDARISEFTLALLEGTGWYQVDYTKAEPMTWGKGRGCPFLEGPCMDTTTQTAKYNEFCSPMMARGCSYTGRQGSICGAFGIKTATMVSGINWWGNSTKTDDQYGDNCPTFMAFSNTDCEDPTNIATAKVGGSSSGYGSKCFMGTLSDSGSERNFGSYCFTPTCEMQAGGNYLLKVQIGGNTISCGTAGQVSIPGYVGTLTCPDPDIFCNRIENEGYCRRKCTGKGTCSNKVCQCLDGWGSYDCSARVYTDNCSRCSNGDPMKTSCYGDTCACNPADRKCNPIVNSPDSNTGLIIGLVAGGVVVLLAFIVVIKFRKALAAKLKRKTTDVRQKSNQKAKSGGSNREPQAAMVPQEQRDISPSLVPSATIKQINLDVKDHSPKTPAQEHVNNQYNMILSPEDERMPPRDIEEVGLKGINSPSTS